MNYLEDRTRAKARDYTLANNAAANGGAQVRWRSDGEEIFYIGLDDRLMAVPIHLARTGQSVEAGVPIPLFATQVGGAVQGPAVQHQYTVALDGQRFLMSTIIEEPAPPVTLILNWSPERKKGN